MAEEGEGQSGLATDPAEALVDDLLGLADGVEAQVGEFASLEIAPHLLDRVEVGGIAREPLDDQPPPLLPEEGLHGPTAMGRRSVPDERDLVAIQMAVELGEELHDGFVVVATRLHAEDEGGVAAVGPEAERGRHRQALPVEAVGEDRGLPLGCPGGPHRGEEAEPALVLEDDPGVPGPGVFFRRGQRSLTHCSMASSLRSAA